ncbi:MAG: NAD(P)H-hydrate dehydratase [Bacteroidia bacterium]
MEKLNDNTINALIKPRAASSNKGNHGHALIVAGSKGKMGACVIAAKACLRSGVGLLTVNVPNNERLILQTAIPEAMLIMREDDIKNLNAYSSIGIGPGIGLTEKQKKIIRIILNKVTIPLLLDADALNIIAANKNLLKKIPENTVITPHPIEFDRLFGTHHSHVERIKMAVELSKKYNIVIVLKGAKTLITYKGEAVINTTGNAGLAKAGSGDALTGVITAFLAQGYNSYNAAKLGVYLHGLSADIALEKQSMESMLITDVIECIGKAFKHIMN